MKVISNQSNFEKVHSKIKKLIDIKLPPAEEIQSEEEVELVKSLIVDGIVDKLGDHFSISMDFNGIIHTLKEIKEQQLKERVLKLAVKIPRVIELMRQS